MTSSFIQINSENKAGNWQPIQNKNVMNICNTKVKKEPLPEVLFITSFPPRECGIATYSNDLIYALNNQFCNGFITSVCALETNSEQHKYAPKPKFILNTEIESSFIQLASAINKDIDIKMVLVEHEFGFFVKNKMAFAHMISQINKPIIFAFHTVLPNPDVVLEKEIQYLIDKSSAALVMTKNSATILINQYNISANKISIIAHGSHLVPPVDRNELKSKYQFSNKKILSTFGLLGPSKSIETTLEALPRIIKLHPEVLFLVLGKTHPAIVKNDGEVYREMLEAKVRSLQIEQNVMFINEYLPLPILLEYLQLTDVYLFTSNDPNQAVSGTFSYALSCGCPVISTPIPHAKEVLSNNNGIIIDFDDAIKLSETVNLLLGNESLRAEFSLNSLQQMAPNAWQNSAILHALLFKKIASNTFDLKYKWPTIKLNHVQKMTTDFGIIQFSKIANPDIETGYTLDDNARALISLARHFEMFEDRSDLKLITTYLLFIKYCLQDDGTFLNYLNSEKDFVQQNNDENLEDSNGRAIWALGYFISLNDIMPLQLIQLAEDILHKAVNSLEKIHSTRAMAFIVKGLHYENKKVNLPILEKFADRLTQMYRHEKTAQWFWFENYLTYGNSLLPESMLCAFLSTRNQVYKKIALDSFDFLLEKIFVENRIKVVSNKGWLIKDQNIAYSLGGEQPIDVAYTIMALEKFYSTFKKVNYLNKATIAFNWFLGANHLNQIVYNPCTGGCYDGVEEHNVNLNQGAESTLSYLMARLSIQSMYAIENQNSNLQEIYETEFSEV